MENQRVRLTKALLKNALIHILQKKPIEKITIYELCDQAQINRTTFYKYYGSQYDLLNDIENDLFSELDRHLAAIDQEELDNLKQVMEYLLEEQEKCTVLINTVPDQEFSEKLFSLPADAPCAEAVDTADGSWKRTVSSKGAGGVTALCPVESRLYLGLAGSEKVRSANL